MIEFQPSQPEFKRDFEGGPNTLRFFIGFNSLAEAYQKAYAGFPWYENLPTEEVKKRLINISVLPGFESFILENPDNKVIGAEIFDKPSLGSMALRNRYTAELAIFAANLIDQTKIKNLVWENELLVHPDFQKRGIATSLRKTFLTYLAEKYPEGSLILTRLRDDNMGTIKSAEKYGFQRSGVRILASKTHPNQEDGLMHEFWYKIVEPQK